MSTTEHNDLPAANPGCNCATCRTKRILAAARAEGVTVHIVFGTDGRLCRLFEDAGAYVELPPSAGIEGELLATAMSVHLDARMPRKPIPAAVLDRLRAQRAMPVKKRAALERRARVELVRRHREERSQ
jgi:hypothetical protein